MLWAPGLLYAPLVRPCRVWESGRPRLPSTCLHPSRASQKPHKPLHPCLRTPSSRSQEMGVYGSGKAYKTPLQCVNTLTLPPVSPFLEAGAEAQRSLLVWLNQAGPDKPDPCPSPIMSCKFHLTPGRGTATALVLDHPVLSHPSSALTASNLIQNSQVHVASSSEKRD